MSCPPAKADKNFIIALLTQNSTNILILNNHQREVPPAPFPFSAVRKKTGVTAGAYPAVMQAGLPHPALKKLPDIRPGKIKSNPLPLP